MEIILRKIMVCDRLPDKKGNYHCKRTNDIAEITLYFIPDMPHYVNKFKNVEYWWEEASLMDITVDSFVKQISEEDINNYRKITDKMVHDEDQERYKKALELCDNKKFVDSHTTSEVINKALKIAAGIK